MATKIVTDSNFDQEVLSASGTILVDFWAEWCGPCRIISPALEEIAEELGAGLTVAKLDVDDNDVIPARYGIRSIPTLMIFRDGQLLDTRLGAAPKGQLREWIDSVAPDPARRGAASEV
jgi:thioredoxin 1